MIRELLRKINNKLFSLCDYNHQKKIKNYD